MMIKFAESEDPVFRATSPLSRGKLKSKGGGKLSIHFSADGDTVETVFRTIISVDQLSIYGAISDLCEECKTCHVRTGRPVVAGQSGPLLMSSVMKTRTLLTDDLAQEEDGQGNGVPKAGLQQAAADSRGSRTCVRANKRYCTDTKNELKGYHNKIV